MTEHRRICLGKADIAEGELRGLEAGERNILVARVGGSLKALDDVCNHAGCLLSGGHIEDNLVVCPCHDVGFDLDTGKNVTDPDLCDDQPTVRVEEVAGELFLLADE